MKKGKQRAAVWLCAALTALTVMGCGQKNDEKKTETAFIPSLDTERNVTLEVAGFLGNFEALDQVVNDFNEYYPNVSVSYEQNSGTSLVDYLENNEYVDIFMTSKENIDPYADESMNVRKYCLDLSKEDVDTEAIDPELVEACTVDGQLLRIPLAKQMCGMVVNKTLLQKEGLNIPVTYPEFLSVCEALKKKGYVPIQSSQNHAYSDMILPMGMYIVGSSEELTAKAAKGDTSYAEALRPVYEHLDELILNGYVDNEVNKTYPDDNYDGAILKFFEGDVPFWIANTESFSGMKKRESKSEAFTAEPFEYAFVNVPLGDGGVYDYEEPWYGFSVNRNSDETDYAVEFMKFLMTKKELNKLAEIKGMPAVTVENEDARFEDALNPVKSAGRYVYNGGLSSGVTGVIADAGNQLGHGDITGIDAAIEAIKNRK